MSYILDALRKSDQQRQRGATPTLLTTQATEAAPKQPALLLYGLFATALVGAGIAIGWLRPWQPAQHVPVSEPATATTFESKPTKTTVALLPVLPEKVRKPAPELPGQKVLPTHPASEASTSVQRDTPMLARTGKSSIAPQPLDAISKQVMVPAPDKPAGAAIPDVAQEQKVMTMGELPVSVQQEIPAMSISLHAYSSKSKERLVSINDKLLREGESPSPGLKLEQITPDGMIFSYKGYRFSRGVQ